MAVAYADNELQGALHRKPTDLDELKAMVLKRRDQAADVRRRFEGQYYLNLAFYGGRQWVYWSRTTHKLETPRLPAWREMVTINFVFPIIEQLVAKETKNRPVWRAQPATKDEEDINAAKASDRFLEYIWKMAKMDEKWSRTKLWKRIVGKAFLKPYWDPTQGERVTQYIDPQTQEVVPDELIEQIRAEGHDPDELFESVSFNLGDIRIDVVPFDRVLVDPAAEVLHDAQWVIFESVRTVEWVKQVYGVDVPPEQIDESPNVVNSTIGGAGFSGLDAGDEKGKQLDHHAKVIEYWEVPSDDCPEGMLFVTTEARCIWTGPHPYKHKQLPLTEYEDIHVPNRFWSDAITKHLITPQANINKTYSRIAETEKLTSNPQILAPKGSIQTQRTREPGLVVEYLPMGDRPVPIPAPSVPAYMFQHIKDMIEAMQFISGVREISMGSAPSGVTSGVALSVLAERDDTRIGPKVLKDEESLERLGTQVLSLAQQYYTEPRQLRIVGDDGEVEVFDFQGADIRATDVVVEMGSSMPQSKAAREAMILEMVQRGILNPGDPEEKKKILRYLDIGITDELYEEAQLDISRAKYENRQMASGQPVRPEIYDDHMVHITEHDNFRKRNDFDKLPDMLKQLFEQHVQMHKALQVRKEQEQLLLALEVQSVLPQPPPQDPGGPSGGAGVPAGHIPSGGMEPPLPGPPSPPGVPPVPPAPIV